MQWTVEAEAAFKKVPFFVRKKVRSRVEKEAAEDGKTVVDIEAVKTTQKRYISGMAAEVKGYQLDTCFGPSGCPNRSVVSDELVKRLEQILQAADLLFFLKEQVGDDLKINHEFRLTLPIAPMPVPSRKSRTWASSGRCCQPLPRRPVPIVARVSMFVRTTRSASMKRWTLTVNGVWHAANASLHVPQILWEKRQKGIGCYWVGSWEGIRGWQKNCLVFLMSNKSFAS